MYKSKKSKALTLTAGLLLLVSSVLSGCGKSNSTADGSSAASVASSTQQATTTQGTLEPYEIKWYIDAGPQQADINTVQDALNKQLKDSINATVNIISVDFGNYDQKMQMVIASGEKFDLCFTANWANNYYQNVNKGAFLPLDDLLDQYAPTINTTLPKIGWDAAKVKGKIYAIPNYQIWAMTNDIVVRKDLADKYKFDPTKVTKLEDLTPFFENVKKGEQGITPNGVTKGCLPWGRTLVMNGFDEIAGRDVPGVIKLGDTNTKVVNQFESEEFKNNLKIVRDWYQKGYIRKDAATLSDMEADKKAGKVAFQFGGNYSPGADVGGKAQFGGNDVYDVPVSKSYLLTSSIIATMTAVSKTSEDPARAVMFYDLLFKDKTLYNTLTFGIENKHYKTNSDGTVEMIKNSGYDYSGIGWEFGNQFNAKFLKGQASNIWDETVKLNNSAEGSPILGFSFDPEPVKTELANCNSVVSEYSIMLQTGSVDPDKILPEFLSKLKSAGVDKLLAEEQKQIDQWKKDNGK